MTAGAVPVGIDEDLVDTAVLARRLAVEHCPADATGVTCAWYHGFWPTLRLLGMAGSPDRHREFFLDALGRLAAGGGSRVLVSGAADSSMLAHVVEAWRSSGLGPGLQATVLDRCPTPTMVSAAYGERVGVAVEPVVADALDFTPGDAFDLICTHSFLSQFSATDRLALVDGWRRALRPGGHVVTTARLSPPGTADPITFSPAQVDAFEAAAAAAAERRGDVLGQRPAGIAAAARRYAERLVVHPTFSTTEVAALFEDGGFVLEQLDEHHVAGAMGQGSGPTTNQPATHLQIVARRD